MKSLISRWSTTVNAILRFATREPTVCAVCRRRAVWLGYVPHYRRPGSRWRQPRGPVIWLCADNGCHAVARKVYRMPNPALDACEHAAALEAGAAAGAYLEEIDKFDLRTLDESEWREFLRRLFAGFEVVMRRKILGDESPPF
jgi:hypothetical protein